MRNATILVVRLRGIATEAIKNVVLAGIGKLVIVDGEEVAEEDLGAGFFYRDEDVGRKVSLFKGSLLFPPVSVCFFSSKFGWCGVLMALSRICAYCALSRFPALSLTTHRDWRLRNQE
jgi:hypothetical protein